MPPAVGPPAPPLQVGAQGFLDVAGFFAQLFVLEGAHEVPCQFLDRKTISTAGKDASLFHPIRQHLGIFGEIDVTDGGSTSKEGRAEFPESRANFGM